MLPFAASIAVAACDLALTRDSGPDVDADAGDECCTDLVDLDGRTDCSDMDCRADRVCLAIMPEDCDDGMDNDADRLIDPADWDCPRTC